MLGKVLGERLRKVGERSGGHDDACHEMRRNIIALLVGMIDVEEVDAGLGIGRTHDRGIGVDAAHAIGACLDVEANLLALVSHDDILSLTRDFRF